MTEDSEAAEHWDQVRGALHQALELDAHGRAAFLDEVRQNDAALGAELDSLLDASSGHAWLDTPAFAGDVAVAMLDEDGTAATRSHEEQIGHYQILDELGHGGMGIVYKAVDERLGRTVALKLLTGGVTGATDNERRRFIREARSASALNHPNIITIHEFDSDHGRDFIVMEYIEGKTLDNVLSEGVALPVALDYARQVAIALSKAHAAGIIHRDLKPGNIMVTTDGQVKVLDFGLAKHRHDNTPASDSDETQTTQALTMAGAVLGTPSYMSPEQVMGQAPDERSDIFSFGIILYQIACGHRPFHGSTHQATMVRIAGQPYRPVREVNRSAPPALAALIDRCLRKKREDRLPSMELAAAQLSAILAASPVREPVLNKTRRRLTVALILATALLATAAGAWFGVGHRRESAPPVTPSSTHALRYSIELQDASGAIRDVPATTVFQGGTKFRLRAAASESGYLYVVNEGPDDQGKSQWIVLSPRPSVSAAIMAHEEKHIGWVTVDRNPGLERFWVVWSGKPVALLESIVQGPSKGVVDTGHVVEVQNQLEQARSNELSENRAADEIQAEGTGNIFGTRIELRHR